MKLIEVLAGASVAVRIVQARLVVVITLVMTFALFGAAMLFPDWLRITIAAAWGLLIFLPVLWRTGRGGYDGALPQDPAQHPEGETRSG